MYAQDPAGHLVGEDSVPVAEDAVLIFTSLNTVGAGAVPFNPLMIKSGANSIKWSYELNTTTTPTVGGAVIQVLSCFVGPMTIEGLTAGMWARGDSPRPGKGGGGWIEGGFTPIDELMQIADWFLAVMQAAGTENTVKNFRDERSVRFQYPARGWDFRLMITGLEGFKIDKNTTAVPWSITGEIVSDNALDYFNGATMAGFVEPLNDKMLQNVISSPKFEFAHNPFVNPALPENDPSRSYKNMGDNFQGLIAAWSTGDFQTWGFSTLGAIADPNYNDDALGKYGRDYHHTSGLADYWTKQVGGYWVGSGGSVSDYRVSSGHGSGPPNPAPPPTPPPSGDPPPTDCGDSDCYNKTMMKIIDQTCLVNALAKWMSDRGFNPALVAEAALMISLAKQYNINPFLYPVICLLESSGGTTGCAISGDHNPWGNLKQGTGSDCVHYDNFDQAARGFFDNLTTNSAYKGTVTVCDVISHHAPANDNPTYMGKFLDAFKSALQAAGKCISCKSSAPPPPPKPKGCKALGESVASLARSYVGKLHDYGHGRSWWPWDRGDAIPQDVDCSSFAAAMYWQAGCHIFNAGSDTYNMIGQGEAVSESLSALQPGDLIFYNTDGGTNEHMGIYVGGGCVVDMGKNRDRNGNHGAYLHCGDWTLNYGIAGVRRYCKDCGQ